MSMPVSGPGAYSQRTDKQPVRNPGGLPYGENQELANIQAAAPMAATPPPEVVPLNAPTNRPNQPVTAGADAGAGPGSEVLQQRPYGQHQQSSLVRALMDASGGDATGTVAALLAEAMRRGL